MLAAAAVAVGPRALQVLARPGSGAALLSLLDDVHVWLAPLDVSAATVDRLQAILSAEERVRAARYHAATHRRRFIVRRARLRELLGSYLDCAPGAVEVEEVSGGKPRLAGDAGGAVPLEFSVSHSGDLAAFAVGTRAVGVDLERTDATVNVESVISLFTARERALISGARPDARLRRFFECWTCKEAYVKATGSGLAAPLDTFDVSEALGRPGLVPVDTGEARAAGVAVQLLRAPSRHAMALACEVAGNN